MAGWELFRPDLGGNSPKRYFVPDDAKDVRNSVSRRAKYKYSRRSRISARQLQWFLRIEITFVFKEQLHQISTPKVSYSTRSTFHRWVSMRIMGLHNPLCYCNPSRDDLSLGLDRFLNYIWSKITAKRSTLADIKWAEGWLRRGFKVDTSYLILSPRASGNTQLFGHSSGSCYSKLLLGSCINRYWETSRYNGRQHDVGSRIW